MDNQQLINNW